MVLYCFSPMCLLLWTWSSFLTFASCGQIEQGYLIPWWIAFFMPLQTSRRMEFLSADAACMNVWPCRTTMILVGVNFKRIWEIELCIAQFTYMKALSSLWVFWWLLRLPHWRKFEIANFTQESNFSMLRIFMFLQRCFVWIVHCTKCAALPISWMCVFVHCQSPFIWKIFGTQGTFENVWCHPNVGFLMKNKWLFWY